MEIPKNVAVRLVVSREGDTFSLAVGRNRQGYWTAYGDAGGNLTGLHEDLTDAMIDVAVALFGASQSLLCPARVTA